MMNQSNLFHIDLIAAQKQVYEPLGLTIEDFALEKESKDYDASEFVIHQLKAKFRVAKTTPTKVGQFVTVWKRIGHGPIQPFDISDPYDLFIISTRTPTNLGQFIFPKQVLYEKGILSKNEKGGKRGFRVYPPWDTAKNQQAIQSQQWQLPYFFEIVFGEKPPIHLLEKLLLVKL